MKKLVLTNIVMLVIIIFLSMSYFQPKESGIENILEIINENPSAKYFLRAYPEARVQGYVISKDIIEREIDEIRENCGPDFEEKAYWKFQYTEQKQNKTMTIWMDPQTRETICIVQELLNQDVVIPFGIKQTRKDLSVKKGQTLKENIYFYNINGNETYYVEIDVLEKPPWRIEVKPPVHLYKPMGKDPIEMNVKVEPSKLELVKPEKHPPDESYIEVDGIEGFVKSKPVELTFYTPRPAPFKEYEKEKFNLKLNITSSYFRGMRSFHYESQILNYTITLT